MKRLPIIFILLVPLFLLFENCGSEEEEIPNKAPTCSFTSPSNNAVIELGTIASVSISANDTDGKIVSIKISIDDVSATTLQVSPYKYDWNTAGLAPGTHTIKAVALDDGGLTAMAQVTIELAADAPSVTTDDITEITGTAATSGGNVTDDGGVAVTSRGIVWGESSGPSLESKVGFTEDESGKGAFVSNLADLTPATTYFVRAYATNSAGTAYGEEKSFMTSGLPTVVTGEVSEITHESAKCGGEVTDDGGAEVTARGIVWNTTVAAGPPTIDDNDGIAVEGAGLGAFSAQLSALAFDTRYQVRAYAANSSGTAYGEIEIFETLYGPPEVSALEITDVTAYTANVHASVTEFGGSKYVYVGILWSTQPDPDVDQNEGSKGSNFFPGNDIDYVLTDLKTETKYYVRAIAKNTQDLETVGEVSTFTTTAFSVQTSSFTDSRDNMSYKTVTIGTQTWMAENLAYLPEVCDVDTKCGYWVYDYAGTDLVAAKSTSNYIDYGVLYSQEMAIASCPTGWHLPSSDEWSLLEINIGMEYNYAYGNLNRKNTTEGDKLKQVGDAHWNDPYADPNTGTNVSGFTALPGGVRDISTTNTFQWMGRIAYFWTSTIIGNTSDEVIYRTIHGSAIGKNRWSKVPYENMGMSVRCVKD